VRVPALSLTRLIGELAELLGRHRLSELVAEPGECERMRVLGRDADECLRGASILEDDDLESSHAEVVGGCPQADRGGHSTHDHGVPTVLGEDLEQIPGRDGREPCLAHQQISRLDQAGIELGVVSTRHQGMVRDDVRDRLTVGSRMVAGEVDLPA
jgi:hypothetical protein